MELGYPDAVDKLAAMFTGIVQARGVVAEHTSSPIGSRLCINAEAWRPAVGAMVPGDSVCVSGVCLTLVEHRGVVLAFDVVRETLARTTLAQLSLGDEVNLEAALTPTTALGGHFVQGHVDCLGRILRVQDDQDDRRITIEPMAGPDTIACEPGSRMDAIVPKGSITVDGVSLTVAAVGSTDFQVALIPTTLERTTLGSVEPSDEVNLETDVISKTVVHWLRRQARGRAHAEGLD